MVRAVVFDLDGTLVHFDIDYVALKREVLTALSRLGIPTSSLSPNDTLTDLLDKVEAYIRASGLNNDAVKKIWDEIYKVAERFENSSIGTAKPMPGAVDVLAALKEKGLKIGLITLNSSVVALNVLNRLGIKRFFDVMVARDFVEPGEVVVVGDTVFDVRCAKELGAVAVGITTGRSSEEELRRAGADYIISSLVELLPLLAQLGLR